MHTWTINKFPEAANLPRLDWRDLFTVREALSDEEAGALDAYFRQFLPPGDCAACSAQQGVRGGGDGLIDSILARGAFTWGLANGEGYCRKCGYPARAYHRDVGPIKFLCLILQYHPDELGGGESPVPPKGDSAHEPSNSPECEAIVGRWRGGAQ